MSVVVLWQLVSCVHKIIIAVVFTNSTILFRVGLSCDSQGRIFLWLRRAVTASTSGWHLIAKCSATCHKLLQLFLTIASIFPRFCTLTIIKRFVKIVKIPFFLLRKAKLWIFMVFMSYWFNTNKKYISFYIAKKKRRKISSVELSTVTQIGRWRIKAKEYGLLCNY